MGATARLSWPSGRDQERRSGDVGEPMNTKRSAAALEGVLEALGYTDEHRRDRVGSPTNGVVADVVAFTHIVPQDLRTSAISAFAAPQDGVDELLHAARLLATPFALIEASTGGLDLYAISSTGEPPAKLHKRIPPSEVPELRGSELAAELAPRVIRAAKAGMRQLTLCPWTRDCS